MRSLLLFLCLRGFVLAEALPYTVPPRPVDADRPTLVEDHPNLLFRTAAQLAAAYKGDATGLADLKMSGSSEFNSVSLAEILKGLPTRQVTVVDLRQESHVLINDRLVTWEAGEDWVNVVMDTVGIGENNGPFHHAGSEELFHSVGKRMNPPYMGRRLQEGLHILESPEGNGIGVSHMGQRLLRRPVSLHHRTGHSLFQCIDFFIG